MGLPFRRFPGGFNGLRRPRPALEVSRSCPAYRGRAPEYGDLGAPEALLEALEPLEVSGRADARAAVLVAVDKVVSPGPRVHLPDIGHVVPQLLGERLRRGEPVSPH